MRNSSTSTKKQARFVPRFETLEERLAPVIGAGADAPAVARGGDFDGVVRIVHANGLGTGALADTTRHIITANHVVAGAPASQVRFELERDGRPINIDINVPAGAGFTTAHPTAAPNVNDLAVLQLVDQEAGMMLVNRQLVAPYYGGTEARGYQLFTGADEIGRTVTLVGYGHTGSGAVGNRSNEEQSVMVPAGVANFQLSLDGVNFTPNIPRAASAALVARRLSGLAAIGNNNVAVQRVGAGNWNVRFINAMGGQNVAQLQSNVAAVVLGTTRQGVFTAGTKRTGLNTWDQADGGGNRLVYDFDNGVVANDNLRAARADEVGQGANEAKTAPGDSGGPAFVTEGGRMQISGVTSFSTSAAMPPDIDEFVIWNGAVPRLHPNGTFGETSTMMRISRYAGNFLSRTAAAGQVRPLADPAGGYDLVLDMNQQVFGNDTTAAGAALIENITITARRNGANLELVVNNANSARYSGTYFVGAAASINSLTIRGSADNETFNLEGNLGINQITVIGRAGDDTLQIVSAGNPIGAGGITFDGGGGSNVIVATRNFNYTLTDASLTIAGQGTVSLQNVQRARLTGGAGANTFTVSGWTHTADLDGQGGTDVIASTNDANFMLTNAQLTRSTGGTFNLAAIERANLTGGAGNNTFTVTGWTGGGTLDGAAGADDEVIAVNDANFTLSNTRLIRSSGGTLTLANVEKATLTGGASANVFTVSDWTGNGRLDGQAGDDEVRATDDTNFTLTNTQLTRSAGGALTLASVEKAALTGGAGANTFTVTGWTGTARLDGNAGTDEVIAADNANYTLTNTSLVRSTGGTVTLAQIERASLTGGADDNSFTVSGWTGTANLDGIVGDDTVIATNNADFTLSDTQLIRSTGGTFNLRSIERATLSGGDGNNTFTVSGWSGKADLDGQGGSRDRVVSADDTDFDLNLGILTLASGARFVLRNTEEADLSGGAGANAFTLDWDGLVRIDGQAGDDRLTVQGGTVTLNLANTEDWLFTQGTVTLDNNVAVNTFVMNGGTLTGKRSLSIRQDGSWNGGTWEGQGGNALVGVMQNAAFEIAGPAAKRLVNYELLNLGTVHWVGASDVTIVTSTITNEGTFTLLNRVRLLGDGRSRFVNSGSGTLQKIGLDGIATFRQVRVENAGSVRVVQSSLDITDGDYVQSGGSTMIDEAGFLGKNGDPVQINGGVIGGDGLVTGERGDVLNVGGKMAPGGTPGHLLVTGKYTQRGGAEFEAELRNQIADTGHDLLTVEGGVSLAGKLTVVPLPGFNGNQFTLIQNKQPRTTPVDGTFQGLPEGAQLMVAGQAYRITYKGGDGNDVVLHKVNQVPEIRVGDAAQFEGTGGNTEFRFAIGLSRLYGEKVSVTYRTVDGTATGGSDYQAGIGAIDFDPGEFLKEIVITVVGDATVEPNERFFVQLTGATNGAIVQEFGVGTIFNDDNAPLPANDTIAGVQGTPLQVNVLANDTDPDGTPLFVTAAGPATNGTVTVNSDQTVTYTPNTGFAGIDSFTYVASDGANTASATVYVTVDPTDPGIYLVGGQPGEVVLTFTWTEREASYDNELFFYRVDDADGRIGNLLPSDPGYAGAALQRALSESTIIFVSGEGPGATRSFTLTAGTLIAFGFAQNDTTAAWNSANPGNALDVWPHGFFSLDQANPDAFDHFRRSLDMFFVEDLDGGGDADFDDIVFRIAANRP